MLGPATLSAIFGALTTFVLTILTTVMIRIFRVIRHLSSEHHFLLRNAHWATSSIMKLSGHAGVTLDSAPELETGGK